MLASPSAVFPLSSVLSLKALVTSPGACSGSQHWLLNLSTVWLLSTRSCLNCLLLVFASGPLLCHMLKCGPQNILKTELTSPLLQCDGVSM